MANPTTISLLLFFLFHFTSAQTPDLNSLLSFKSAADTSNKLTSWNATADPCTSSSWYGVSCSGDRVSKLVLEDLSLSGSFNSLASLTGLRVLSLSRNLLSGNIPDLSNLTSLKLLFLSHNSLSGELPNTLSPRLFRLDLSFNNLSGHIPPAVNRLPHLLTLRLESNTFSGPISDLNLQNLQDFNVSGNNLVGQIPRSLSAFSLSSFAGNRVLCGPPLSPCKAVSTDPTRPGSAASSSTPVGPAVVVSSSPSSNFPPVPNKPEKAHHGGPKMSLVAIIALIVGDLLILLIISLLLYCYFWRNYAGKKSTAGEKIVYSSSHTNPCPYPYPVTNPGGGAQQSGLDRGRMVFFEGARKFELEDLLRASAEMLGKGVTGTTYKAVLDDGSSVAVKRLKVEAGGKLKGEFEQQMEVLGMLRHPNVVALKAYYFAREEKLLVSDFMPNSSLSWLLHGNRGPGRTPLDWTTRLKMASGAARGVAFMHSSCKPLKLTHGNIKSTNVLIDKAGDARVSDFGLSSFIAPNSNASKTNNGYRAPEIVDGRKITHKADVYSFGVLLLELLTGKCPSMVEGNGSYGRVGMGGAVDLPRWVQSVVREEWTAEVFDLELMRYKDIEEEMVGLLQIAMACTSGPPDQRPKMAQVVKMIDEIRGGGTEVSPSHDTSADSADSRSVSEDTCGVSQ
ncbi:hypothetical protein V2J09_008609 [Rumex salicifolius]